MKNNDPPHPTQCHLHHTSEMRSLSTNDSREERELVLTEIHNKISTEFREADKQ